MTQEILNKIKKFADVNFCKANNDCFGCSESCELRCSYCEDTEIIYANNDEVAVTNPWMDDSARWVIDDVEAVKIWGLATVVDFIEKAKEKI